MLAHGSTVCDLQSTTVSRLTCFIYRRDTPLLEDKSYKSRNIFNTSVIVDKQDMVRSLVLDFTCHVCKISPASDSFEKISENVRNEGYVIIFALQYCIGCPEPISKAISMHKAISYFKFYYHVRVIILISHES